MPFADELLPASSALHLAEWVTVCQSSLGAPTLRAAADQLNDLALRERSDLLRDALRADVPGGYAPLAALVREVAGDMGFTGWIIWPVTCAVAEAAADDGSPAALDDALDLLAELTGRLTAEFAIRSLLRIDIERALAAALRWTSSDDWAVRRLASEGTRTHLPWGTKVPDLINRPDATLPILEALRFDPSEDVRRSVANHLNDLSRANGELVVATVGSWLKEPRADADTKRMVRHALRTLVKRGDPDALAVLGFHPASVTLSPPVLGSAVVCVGDSVRFAAEVTNIGTESATVAIDYVVFHQKANGTQSPKTFKLTTRTLMPGERVEVSKEHSFRPITTRRYHSGAHAIAIQANGVRSQLTTFDLYAPGAT